MGEQVNEKETQTKQENNATEEIKQKCASLLKLLIALWNYFF